MQAKHLTVILGLAILALPAAVPASQPIPRVAAQAPVSLASTGDDLRLLLANPYRAGEFSIVLPTRFTTLGAEVSADSAGS